MTNIKISEFDTIYGDNFEEISTDEFFHTLEKKLDLISYNIEYLEDKEYFIVTYKYEEYILTLDNMTMDYYKQGRLINKNISRIHKILTKANKLREYQKIQQEKERYIEEGDKNIFSSNEAKRVYIDYLKDKIKYRPIKILKETFYDTSISGKISKMMIFAIVAVEGITFWTQELNNEESMCLIFVSLFPIIRLTTISIKNNIKRLKNRKLYKLKIDTLEKELSNLPILSNSIKEFDKTIDEEKFKDYKFNDLILKQIYDLLNRVSFISIENRTPILERIKEIKYRYLDGLNKTKDNNNELELTNNSFELEKEIIKEIALLEQEILEIRQKEMGIDKIEQESMILDEMIKNLTERECIELDINQISQEQAKRQDSYVLEKVIEKANPNRKRT